MLCSVSCSVNLILGIVLAENKCILENSSSSNNGTRNNKDIIFESPLHCEPWKEGL